MRTSRFVARVRVLALCAALLATRSAAASVIGEENVLLGQILGAHLHEIASLTTIVNNTRQSVAATNDLFALTRALQRTYQMLINYRIEDLVQDAKRGLYNSFPELEDLDNEIRMGVDNVRAISAGSDAFFTHWDRHDPVVGDAVNRAFRYGYRSSIWPVVFPDAMKFHPNPSPTESLVQSYYLSAGEGARRAIQRSAMGVLASKISELSKDAEAKDNAQLKNDVTNTQLQMQTMQNTTDLLNLKEIEVAREENRRLADKQVNEELHRDLAGMADTLGSVGGRRR